MVQETDQKKEVEQDIELSYSFTISLNDGSAEALRIPRITTRMKYRLSLFAMNREKPTQDELAEKLIDIVLPGLIDREGPKAPTLISLAEVTAKIFEKDAEVIFGKDPEEASVKKKKGRGRPKKKK